MKPTFKYTTRGGIEIHHELPTKFVACSRCEGKGSHVNPAIDGHGISPEEFAEDPDFEEAYFSGRYDVRCENCDGNRVFPEVDESSLTKKQRRIWELIQKQDLDAARWRAEERMTRFYENGGRDG